MDEAFTIAITLGWWIAPALITIAAFAWHSRVSWGSRGGLDVTPIFTFGAALILSLLAWLIWAVLT